MKSYGESIIFGIWLILSYMFNQFFIDLQLVYRLEYWSILDSQILGLDLGNRLGDLITWKEKVIGRVTGVFIYCLTEGQICLCLTGIDVSEHDIRFVEDNWESPVIICLWMVNHFHTYGDHFFFSLFFLFSYCSLIQGFFSQFYSFLPM